MLTWWTSKLESVNKPINFYIPSVSEEKKKQKKWKLQKLQRLKNLQNP